MPATRVSKLPLILFPINPLAKGEVDSTFSIELASAQLNGFSVSFYDDDALRAGDMQKALKPFGSNVFFYEQEVILRGYMLDYLRYKAFYEALRRNHNAVLINNPIEYGHAHYWVHAYRHFREHAVESHFFAGKDLTHVNTLRFCPNGAWFMKDYVKSAKPYGVIYDIENEVEFEETKQIILQERGNQFYDGFCLKRFQNLAKDWQGKPLEMRLFFYRGQLISVSPTHGINMQNPAPIPFESVPGWVKELAASFKCNFFTVDLGILNNGGGDAIVLETGDGGVSGLSPDQQPLHFFKSLADAYSEHHKREQTEYIV